MFVIDHLQSAVGRNFVVSPFHTGHLGFVPGTQLNATFLQAAPGATGHELCITPYEHGQFPRIFRLNCVLKEQPGVVHKLLRAVASLRINILSLESAVLESKRGHGVSALLDWSTTNIPDRIPLPPNLARIFFPLLSGIVPSDDRRYLVLLRQILGQCADVLDWSISGNSRPSPRLNFVEFDEARRLRCSEPIAITRISNKGKSKPKLNDLGVQFELPPKIENELRLATGREYDQDLHYILLSEINSRTLRVFVPNVGRERRMIQLAFAHNNRPGALFTITKLIADSGLSIFSCIVRKTSTDQNIFEVVLEHEAKEFTVEELVKSPDRWVKEHLVINDPVMVRHFSVTLCAPEYPKRYSFEAIRLYAEDTEKIVNPVFVTSLDAEENIRRMKDRIASDPELRKTRWLADLLFAPEWQTSGRPTIFLSYPKHAAKIADRLKEKIGKRMEIKELQSGDAEKLTEEAIRRIKNCHYFIGLWHPELVTGDETKQSMEVLSTWLPFEYGIAKSEDKPTLILAHNSLPSRIYAKVCPNEGKLTYIDLADNDPAVAEIQRRTTEWANEHVRLVA